MPIIKYKEKTIEVAKGANLKKALSTNKLSPHNGKSKFLNCQGFGSCGTCAVEIIGKISSKTEMEKWRLAFPPHKKDQSLRLACQVNIIGDIKIRKHAGFLGRSNG